jgi:hypothetical protein
VSVTLCSLIHAYQIAAKQSTRVSAHKAALKAFVSPRRSAAIGSRQLTRNQYMMVQPMNVISIMFPTANTCNSRAQVNTLREPITIFRRVSDRHLILLGSHTDNGGSGVPPTAGGLSRSVTIRVH